MPEQHSQQRCVYPKNQTNDQVIYKGSTYDFTHGEPINFVNWNFLIDRLDDVRQLVTAVILNPKIIGISDEIPDMFGANRATIGARHNHARAARCTVKACHREIAAAL